MGVIETVALDLKPLMVQLRNLNLSVPHHDFTKILKLRESHNLSDTLEYIVQLDNLAKFKIDEVFFAWNIEGSIISVHQLEFEKMCAMMKAAELFGEFDVVVLKKALACANEANNINLQKRYLVDNSFTSRYLAYIKGKLNICALDKLIQQSKSFSLTCKIAQQASKYFKIANHLEFTAYYQTLALFYSSKDFESQTKYGMQIKRLEEAILCIKTFWHSTDAFNELYAQIDDKLKSAKRDNDMIYLQLVPTEMDPVECEDVISNKISIDFLPVLDPLFSTVLPFDILEHLKLFQDLKKQQIDPRKYHLNNLLSRSKSILEMNMLEGEDFQIVQKFKSSNLETQLMQMMEQLSVSDVQSTLDKVKSLRASISDALNKRFEPLVSAMSKGEQIATKLDKLDNEKGLISVLIKTKGFNKNLTEAMDKYFKEHWLPVLEGLEEFVVEFEQHVNENEKLIYALKEEMSLNLLKVHQVEEEVEKLWKVN